MEYRINKRTGDRISVLGFGTSYIAEAKEKEAVAALRRAYEGGVNFFDLATAEGKTFPYFQKALGAQRRALPDSFWRGLLRRQLWLEHGRRNSEAQYCPSVGAAGH